MPRIYEEEILKISKLLTLLWVESHQMVRLSYLSRKWNYSKLVRE